MLLLAIGALAAFFWAWTRPVPLTVAATPADATITLDDGRSAVGTLSLDAEKPGRRRTLTVTRRGFETSTIEVEPARYRGTRTGVALQPLAQTLRVRAGQSKALVEVLSGGRTMASGKGSVSKSIPAGALSLRVTLDGYNTLEREIFLDRPTSLTVHLDPAGQLVHSLSLSDCSGAPKAVALTPDGRQAWTTILDGPPSIEIFDPGSGRKIGGVELGKYGAVEIVFNRAGTRAYASQMESAKVFEIDVKTRKVVRALDTESAWTKVVALSPDEKTLYAANWSGDDVSEIDLGTGALRRRIRVADTPRGLWPSEDGKTLWVASFGTGDLERIDLATGRVARVFTSKGALRHLVGDDTRGLLYSSDMAKDCVWVTDMKSGKTKKLATVDHKPNTIDLSPDGRVLFVSCRGENNSKSYYLPGPEWGSILILDTENGKPLDAIIGGNQCTALDASTDGRLLVFSDFLDDRLRSYEIPSYEVLAQGGGGRSFVYRQQLAKETTKAE